MVLRYTDTNDEMSASWSLQLSLFATTVSGVLLCEHVLLLVAEQTQESIQRFEQQAGLRDAGYTPHKGLTAEETKYHRVAEAVHVRLVLFWLFLQVVQPSASL